MMTRTMIPTASQPDSELVDASRSRARDNEDAQRLAHLIDQQETMPTHPAFVQTYLALGNQYQKMGKLNEALATWQLGLQKFPGDPSLVKKISVR